MKIIEFTKDDIKDKANLAEQIEFESNQLFKSSYTNKGRSLAEIKESVVIGKTLEVWLCENYPFTLAEDKWHDLIDENGDYVEVKAYNVYDSNAPFVQKSLHSIRNGNWNKSKWFILFQYKNGVYKFLEKIKI